MTKILLVEDSIESVQLICEILQPDYLIVGAHTLKEAREKLSSFEFDLILLDVMMPDGLGFDFCAELRTSLVSMNTPVIFVSGKDEVPDKVNALRVGGDDYISKPFDPMELRARIEAVLARAKRSGNLSKSATGIECGKILVSLEKQRAWIKESKINRDLDLTRIEYRLLVHFITHRGKMLSRSELLKSIWGERIHVSDRTVDRHVSALRSKLSHYSDVSIQAKYRRGYLFSHKSLQ